MASLLNLLVALVGLGMLGSGGYALNIYLDKEPKHKKLSQVEYKNTTTTHIAGIEVNKQKLVADDIYNKDWWDWKYKNTLEIDMKTTRQSQVHTDFKVVVRGYGKNQKTALNKVCASKWTSTSLNDTNLKKSIEKYCVSGHDTTLVDRDPNTSAT